MLCALVDRAGILLTKDQLFEEVWGNVIVSESALTSVIKELRRALGDEAKRPRYIESVYGRGYRFLAETRPAETRPAETGLPILDITHQPAADVASASPAPAVLPPVADEGRPAHWNRRRMLGAGLAVGAVATAAAYHHGWGGRSASAEAEPAFVVVLPFEDFSADRDATFLSVALPREIRDQLSRVAGLRIIAEVSSQNAADKGLSLHTIGVRLGARFVVSGAIKEAKGRLISNVRIFDVAARREILALSRDWAAGDLFVIQQELSGTILREILGRVSISLAAPAPPRVARDPRAYRLVLEARDFLEKSRAARMAGDEEAGKAAGDAAYRAANDALAVDPNDPGALLLIAQLMRNGWTTAFAEEPLTSSQRAARAITYVSRALSIDPNDPAALTALGDYYRRFQWRWEEAETLFRKALMLSPSFIEAHWSFAYMLGTVGRGLEGLHHAHIVFKLDPESIWHRIALPRLLCIVGDRGNMFRRYDIELAATPDNLFLITEIYIVHLCDGDASALDRLVARVTALHGDRKISNATDALLARIRNGAAALRGDVAAHVERIDGDVQAYDAPARSRKPSQHGRLSVDLLYIYAIEYAWAGQNDKAISLLGRALAGHSIYWPAAAPYGAVLFPAALRADPRYHAIWNQNPRTRQYVALRRRALIERKMAGYFPDGRFSRPSQEAISQSLDGV